MLKSGLNSHDLRRRRITAVPSLLSGLPIARPARMAVVAVVACVTAMPALAGETEFTAAYTARLAVLPINFASGTLKATVPDKGRYVVDFGADGMGFAMSGKAIGTVYPDGVWPLSAAIDTADSSEVRKIRIALSRGRVRRDTVTPPLPYRPDRVPVTQEHKKGVIDPISALLMPVAKKSDTLEPSVCDRTLPIFEGTERFDIKMSYLRIENVKTIKGYQGPVVVCRATYKAIAGHRNNGKPNYMEQNKTIEAWLAPIEGTQMVAPWKISLVTGMGTMLIEASEFTATQNPTKHADAGEAIAAPSDNGTQR